MSELINEEEIVQYDEPEDIPVEQENVMPVIDKSKHRTIGTKLSYKDGATAEVVIAHLTSIGEIGLESEEIDVTTHDSLDDFSEFIAGGKDAGEVEISGYLFDEDNFEKLYTLAGNRNICEWTVTYKSGAKWKFKAFIKSIKDGEKGLEDVAGFTANLRISGAPIFTKGTVE